MSPAQRPCDVTTHIKIRHAPATGFNSESWYELRPPAVWLPYNKMGRSSTDLAVVPAGGKFGPFDGQLMVAEFTDAKVSRVFLEKVDVEYQGATFPFLASFASGIVRLHFAPVGSLMVGMTSRG